MSEKHSVDEDSKTNKDEVTLQELVDSIYTNARGGDPRLRLDTGKEHVTFRRKWWQLW